MDRRKILIFICTSLVITSLIWIFFVVFQMKRYSFNFSYSADVISLDNFYDENSQAYLGPQLSKTKFYYETISEENGVLIVRNVFDVRQMTGEKIFSVDRIYGIDSKTGRHVKGYGDRERTGYLFSPNHLKKEDYTYWHINYDEPALMKFQSEEVIDGLKVYRYAADYHADQTANLGFLPGVPEERGVNLNIHLEQWVEPVSGYMVKYEDNTICYYYDQKTKERVHPWNNFNNKYSTTSIKEQIEMAKSEKKEIILLERAVPGFLMTAFFISCGFLIFMIKKG